MHIHVTGEGTPTVVFESGMGASCLSWTLVQPQVAQFTRAVSYDVNRAFAHTYRNEVVGMVLVDSIHPAEWENPTPKQLRISEVSLRYAWIAAWLARLGCCSVLPRPAGARFAQAGMGGG
jgi:hypothetical protein